MRIRLLLMMTMLAVASVISASTSYVEASSCGSIIVPDIPVFLWQSGTTAIEDCDNPFGATTDKSSHYTTTIRGDTIIDGSVLTATDIKAHEVTVTGDPYATDYGWLLFRHDGDDYRYLDTTDNPVLASGVYTLVIKEYSILLNQRPPLQRLFAAIIPIAYAQIPNLPEYLFTVTFTIGEPEPTGASNVLFLPGLMGSRLYEESDVCGSSVNEKERWLSRDECDQLRLATTFTGTSLHDIYTKPGRASIVDEAFTFNTYKTFLNTLGDWVDDELITSYAAVPYDWRLRLDDVLKSKLDPAIGKITYDVTNTLTDSYLYQTLSDLVADSATGRVTIVAHSNGGLVAKHFLTALTQSNDPLADKIDNLILVGVPQLGTPEAMVGVLHGSRVGPAGLVVSQSMVRQLLNTMPAGHHLLPGDGYFSSSGATVATPIITFSSGSVTTPWIDAYGSTITDRETLYRFLRKDSGRTVPDTADVGIPAVVDGFLLDYARTVDVLHGAWVSPNGTQVYQIAGTGFDTPANIEYFTDSECVARNIFFRCTAHEPKLGYRVNMVFDGDGTVVAPSAVAQGDSERWWLDLNAYNDVNLIFERDHKDILEVSDVISFIHDTLQSTVGSYQYLQAEPVDYSNKPRLAFQLHSPLDMWLITADGGEVSSSTATIAGATYRRYGELQYISLPDTAIEKTLILQGIETGSFTLDIEEKSGNTLVTRQTYVGIPSATSTRVEVVVHDAQSLADVVLGVDYDGDGVSDLVYDTEGVVEVEEEEVEDEVVDYSELISAIESLDIRSLQKASFLVTTKAAERYFQRATTHPLYSTLEKLTLTLLKHQLRFAEQLRIITKTERQSIEQIIGVLLRN